MKMKTSELIGTALDWAVAKCEELQQVTDSRPYFKAYSPSTFWNHGGPIIERERIDVAYLGAGNTWVAQDADSQQNELGSTPLIAAMRCYVASKLGDEVEIPEELI